MNSALSEADYPPFFLRIRTDIPNTGRGVILDEYHYTGLNAKLALLPSIDCLECVPLVRWPIRVSLILRWHTIQGPRKRSYNCDSLL
jgi:hypothetical protein